MNPNLQPAVALFAIGLLGLGVLALQRGDARVDACPKHFRLLS
jgi:hypothetical protein